MTTPITAEELFNIIPADEQSGANSIDIIFQKKKKEIDALETRKSFDYYENQREREDAVDYGS